MGMARAVGAGAGVTNKVFVGTRCCGLQIRCEQWWRHRSWEVTRSVVYCGRTDVRGKENTLHFGCKRPSSDCISNQNLPMRWFMSSIPCYGPLLVPKGNAPLPTYRHYRIFDSVHKRLTSSVPEHKHLPFWMQTHVQRFLTEFCCLNYSTSL